MSRMDAVRNAGGNGRMGSVRALIDELAHTNIPGSRNAKRWRGRLTQVLARGVGMTTTALSGPIDVHMVTRIADRGPGIPPAERASVFQPFERLGDRDNRTGVGLGLALARGLTEAMNGTLVPDETPGVIHYAGQPVAIVVADRLEQAQHAADQPGDVRAAEGPDERAGLVRLGHQRPFGGYPYRVGEQPPPGEPAVGAVGGEE